MCNSPEEFNSFLESIFSQRDESAAIDLEYQDHSDDSIFISKEGTVDVLLKFDAKKSPGRDKIPSKYLKRYCESVASSLVKIFSVSLINGALPSQWLLARIVPVYKAGDRLDIGNYRSISITCMAGKILKHVICKLLVEYIKNNNNNTVFKGARQLSCNYLKPYTALQKHLIVVTS